MGLHELVAEQIDFSDPGYLGEKHLSGGYHRYHGLSNRVGSFLCQVDEVSNQSFSDMLIEHSDRFLAGNLPEIVQLPAGEMLSQRTTYWLQSSIGEFGVKQLMTMWRTESAIEYFNYLVHPEEMDLLMRIAYGPAYEEHFGHKGT